MCTMLVGHQQFINKFFMQTSQMKFFDNLTKKALDYEYLAFYVPKLLVI